LTRAGGTIVISATIGLRGPFPAPPRAGRELEHSLRRLGLDYVDLYPIHWPLPLLNARLWRVLEALQERRLARQIGVSNFGRERLAGLTRAAARIPAVNQVEFNPFHYRRRLLDHCLAHGIALEAYSPLAHGHWPDDPTIVAVADRIGRTPAQVMLRWAIQHQALVIPKSVQRDRIRANAQVFDFHLAETDMRLLDALDRTRGTAHARG
jgi:diketogulonate reductase-like aldo/keto reductase